MGFFDLNIPFLETTKSSSSSQNQTLKQNRLKLVIRIMEFGYTGVAYNRTIKGVLSDADYCSIPLFTVSSLIKILPVLSASAKFHRDLLGVPASSPFRQYTRLTVCVDSAPQAMVLNSTNPVLKSYNIVAAKPLNQNAFDQACQFSEVDIITIDFTEKLPFRLKQPIVKAAMQRGVYFEIIYSGLVRDVQTRFQVISNAKMLVDWTSGKNIICTSATSSANELRGPYDIANLASLLGMSMERAKAAVSKNCRNLISKALRKRQYHKEAIKVEALTTSEQLKFSEPSSGDWLKWDPISSGQGDLLLDDIKKCYLDSGDDSKLKAIDFTSIMNDLPSNRLQLKDILSGAAPSSQSQNPLPKLFGRITDAQLVETPMIRSQNQVPALSDRIRHESNVESVVPKSYDTEVGNVSLVKCQLVSNSVLQSDGSDVKDLSNGIEPLVSQQPSQVENADDDLHLECAEPFQTNFEAKDVMITDLPCKDDPNIAHEKLQKSLLIQHIGFEVHTNPEAIIEEPIQSKASEAPSLWDEATPSDLQIQNCVLSSKLDIMHCEEGLESPKHAEEVMFDDCYRTDLPVPSQVLFNFQNSEVERPENGDVASDIPCLASDQTHKATSAAQNIRSERDQVDTAVHNDVMNGTKLVELCKDVEQSDSLSCDHSRDLIMDDLNHEDNGEINIAVMDNVVIGKHRESKKSRRAAVFPLKRLLNNTQFKKKQRKSKGKAKKA
ncbi:hypothetical protein QQ045_003664 [Rhodiola kirilowii]